MSRESKKKRRELLGEVRYQNPPPDRPHSDKKGEKGYSRKKIKKEMYNILEDYDDLDNYLDEYDIEVKD